MILDLQTVFSGSTTAAGVTTGQAVTVTAISTNVLDLRNFRSNPAAVTTPALVDEGILGFTDMYLIIMATEAATAVGAATVTFSLESDSTADLATSATVHYTSAAIGKATLVAGYTAVRIPIPSGDYERYVGVRYTVAVGPLTAGAFRAFLTPSQQRNITYPAGFTI